MFSKLVIDILKNIQFYILVKCYNVLLCICSCCSVYVVICVIVCLFILLFFLVFSIDKLVNDVSLFMFD